MVATGNTNTTIDVDTFDDDNLVDEDRDDYYSNEIMDQDIQTIDTDILDTAQQNNAAKKSILSWPHEISMKLMVQQLNDLRRSDGGDEHTANRSINHAKEKEK
ncbi:hypothetical protein PPL_00171 [Heterostelium album PN500]|uniref:Uncharacterized protein n=1 Tax=Heterostelium pallidum (strain ATCC 26659 / Pp 5 / PN500) TaxID=670386 RepID=D3AVQ6_HETP5|nr:hypothetical protein PPL_00171 [Heterostelium album PN500]EFA86379.1 hypothetical protein PPL_00171 [Heterostelium album PN500]|eukprot:XP_020438484.1 hypothetical protein PPL_00171 [Heterostelium album PN500]